MIKLVDPGNLLEKDSTLRLILHLNQPRSFLFSLGRGPNLAEDLAAVNRVTKRSSELGIRLSLKPEIKELRLGPKVLNRGLG